ncbi:NUDIX hydrolase [Nocardia sp. 348MFTsu5.1]|uniref:NUDIX hydrolase n=1 Tax=Nocardia sp. 348MFTsu5.1 TaxID=1172185 RepID=UPI0003665F57|nr:NUDIX hydrolase [Nocardia sp. 348MFTsu5.1]
MRGDGDGWVFDADGSRYWGRHGAAGLLLFTLSEAGEALILLQHRAVWSHQGGTWALPGGARDSHESAIDTAVREADEEAGIADAELTVHTESVTHRAPSGWTYTTVIAEVATPLVTTANLESVELRWVSSDKVGELPLHPAFGASWPDLRSQLVTIVAASDSDTVS